ncbi:MAG: hypothetical protein AB8G99_26810 [Planctomycetaceae bacterium]
MKQAILKRGLILTAVAGLGLCFRGFSAETNPAVLQQPAQQDVKELANIEFSPDSQWAMAGVPWSLSFRTETADSIGLESQGFSIESPRLEDEALAKVLPYLRIATKFEKLPSGLLLHTLKRTNLVAEVLTTDDEQSDIIAALISRPDTSGSWLTFELRPSPDRHEPLLKLPPPCRVKATRFSEDGSTAQFQVLSNTTLESLAAFLVSQGWKIEAGSTFGESFRCEQNDRRFEITRLSNQSVLLRVCSRQS